MISEILEISKYQDFYSDFSWDKIKANRLVFIAATENFICFLFFLNTEVVVRMVN